MNARTNHVSLGQPTVSADHWRMMRAAELECSIAGREVSILIRRFQPASYRDVGQKWRDEAAEHLAVRKDASI